MKIAIRFIICALLIAVALVTVVECAYGVPNPSTKRIFVGMLIFLITIFISVCIMEPSVVSKRIYAIAVCISAHRAVKQYCNEYEEYAFAFDVDKKSVLYSYTGCNGYLELYQYAKEEYFKK